jgi:catechol 2,3-dioxygenase-like lactoylglutathione lyase family enzyme
MITGLNHINLRAPAELLDRLRDFYRDALGFEPGHRPGFNSQGYWLYAAGQPLLHLSRQTEAEAPRGPAAEPAVFDHFALSATDPEAMAARLRAHGVAFELMRSATTGQHQFFFTDPAGNGVELNFPFED